MRKIFSILVLFAIVVNILPMAPASAQANEVECIPVYANQALATLTPGQAIQVLDNAYDAQGAWQFGTTWLTNDTVVPADVVAWTNWHNVPANVAAIAVEGSWGVWEVQAEVDVNTTGSQGGRYLPQCNEDPMETPSWLSSAANAVLTGDDLDDFLQALTDNLPVPAPEMPTMAITSPTQGEVVTTADVMVTWSADGQQPDSFEIEWDKYSSFSTPEGQFTADQVAVGILLEDLPERTIYVRVRGVVGAEYTDWVEVSFVVDVPEMEVPRVTGDCLTREALDAILAMPDPGAAFDVFFAQDGYRFGVQLEAGAAMSGNWVLHGTPSGSMFELSADANLWLVTYYATAPDGGYAVPMCVIQ